MNLSPEDIAAIGLSLKLASIVTAILLVLGTPIAWWLARTCSPIKGLISAFIAMPLVLPPTVLGFYFLIAMSEKGLIGNITNLLGLGTLPFTFSGLVVASVLYSMPFVIQPIQNAMESISQHHLDAAVTLNASPTNRFFSIVIPLAKPGFITAAVLGFAHTLGEFGVVLMIGGNIQGETKVVSVQLYEQVELLNYTNAHTLSAIMLCFSLVVLFCLYTFTSQNKLISSSRSQKY
jgi:molybdate transport system permease protein